MREVSDSDAIQWRNRVSCVAHLAATHEIHCKYSPGRQVLQERSKEHATQDWQDCMLVCLRWPSEVARLTSVVQEPASALMSWTRVGGITQCMHGTLTSGLVLEAFRRHLRIVPLPHKVCRRAARKTPWHQASADRRQGQKNGGSHRTQMRPGVWIASSQKPHLIAGRGCLGTGGSSS